MKKVGDSMKKKQEDSLIEPSIDELLTKVENKYVLALLCAKRARELFDGDEPLIDEFHINKVTTAINEIDQGKVSYEKIEEDPEDEQCEGEIIMCEADDFLKSEV